VVEAVSLDPDNIDQTVFGAMELVTGLQKVKVAMDMYAREGSASFIPARKEWSAKWTHEFRRLTCFCQDERFSRK